jgi:hypothetical protein
VTVKPDSVRIATRADEAALFFSLAFLENDNGLGWTVSPRKVLTHVQRCCRGQMGLAGVIDGPDGIIGSIAIEMLSPWYSEDLLLVTIWQFVRPEYRAKASYGADLFAFAEWHRQDMAAKIGQPLVLESEVLSHTRLKAKIRLWGRKARQVGAIFWFGP